jgi:hypothetical protein
MMILRGSQQVAGGRATASDTRGKFRMPVLILTGSQQLGRDAATPLSESKVNRFVLHQNQIPLNRYQLRARQKTVDDARMIHHATNRRKARNANFHQQLADLGNATDTTSGTTLQLIIRACAAKEVTSIVCLIDRNRS